MKELLIKIIMLPVKALAIVLGLLSLILPVLIPLGAIYGLFFS